MNAEVEALLSFSASAATQALPHIIASYAIGSLGHGGFCPPVSDVDMAFILTKQIGGEQEHLAEVQTAVEAAFPGPLSQRLSIFWSTRDALAKGHSDGRFPAVDRKDLKDNGRLLAGSDVRVEIKSPSAQELLVEGARFAVELLARELPFGGKKVAARELLSRPDVLIRLPVRELTKALLFPVRFLYTSETGKIGRTDLAVKHFLTAAADDPALCALVARAFAWRTAPPADDLENRPLLHSVVPLYWRFFDDYRRRLIDLGEQGVANEVERCRNSLKLAAA